MSEVFEGVLDSVEQSSTSKGNPKTVLHIKASPDDQYSTRVHYSGDDLMAVPANIVQYRGYPIRTYWDPFQNPRFPDKAPMRMGRGLDLCDQNGQLPPAQVQAAPPPPPPSPAGTGPDPAFAGPPPQQAQAQAPPPQQPAATPPPREVSNNPTAKDLSITRQACIKSPLIAQLLPEGASRAQVRNELEYWVGYCLGTVERISAKRHRQLEALIAKDLGKAEVREGFKEFLFDAGFTEMCDSGAIHLTDLSAVHAEKLLGKWWEQAVGAFKQSEAFAKAAPDVAPPATVQPTLQPVVHPEPDDDDLPPF